MDWPEFHERYWRHRLEYDRGDLSPREYWDLVTDAPLPEPALDSIMAADIAGWIKPNREVLEIYRAASSEWRFAMLSNAPQPLARAICSLEWLPAIEPMIFSCDHRLTKPDPEIYQRAADLIGADPSRILLVDDRSENIEAARLFGMAGALYTDAEQLRSDLAGFA